MQNKVCKKEGVCAKIMQKSRQKPLPRNEAKYKCPKINLLTFCLQSGAFS